MQEEEMKEEAVSMTEEAVEIIIGIMKMMIERQAIGDRVHPHHQGKIESRI